MNSISDALNDIITQIEKENVFVMRHFKSDKAIILDLDYLRHHNLLKDSRIFNMLFGLNNYEFKKEEYNVNKYCELFTTYGIGYENWMIFLEFLRYGQLYWKSEQTEEYKITKLKEFSLIFNIELIDRYVTNYYLNRGKEKDIPNYNPMVPSEDIRGMYMWVSCSDTSDLCNFRMCYKPEDGWSMTNVTSVRYTNIFYARKKKVDFSENP